LQAVGLAERILHDAQFARRRRPILDGRDSVAVGLDPNIRQGRDGSPSIRTVQAPHTPCSQPGMLPPAGISLKVSSSVLRGSTSASRRRLDVQFDPSLRGPVVLRGLAKASSSARRSQYEATRRR